MDWIKNLKISGKLAVLIALGVFFVFLIGMVGFCYLNQIASNLDRFYANVFRPLTAISDTRTEVNANAALTYEFILTKNLSKRANLKAEIIKKYGEIEDNIKHYQEHDMDAEDIKDIEILEDAVKTCKSMRFKVLALAESGNEKAALAMVEANESKMKKILDSLEELQTMAENEGATIDAKNDKESAAARSIVIIALIIALVCLVYLGIVILNTITKPIKIAIDSLNIGSEEVSAASSQVAAASQSLAEGTSEQAASVQETSATLEETASMVHQNRENTQQAATLAKQAKQYAEQSNSEMAKMSASMTELKNSSNEIAKIIKVIDEIAFQTNILSLNAAVEAARAGDAGKGFAVVAEEVRNLAQRSAQAAKDTAVIIEGNVNLSDSSVSIANAVRESVESIASQATKVSDLLEEISVATNEQAQGVEQINQAISQMETVLHGNAQTAEEAASASHTLAEQAINVKEIVNTLVVLVDGADAVHNNYRASITSSHKYVGNRPAIQSKSTLKLAAKSQSPESIIPLNDF